MKLIRLAFSSRELQAVPAPELFFVIISCLFLNEILILQKFLNASRNNDDRNNEVLRKAHLTQDMFLAKLLAGKLFEGWELLQKRFYGNRLSTVYYPLLKPGPKKHLDAIKKYFGKTNAIARVRKQFAFHFGSRDDELQNQMAKLVTELSGAQPLEYYMAEYEGNCLYTLSHSLVNYLMLTNTENTELFDSELHQVSKWFTSLIQDIIRIFTERYKWDHSEVEIPDPPVHHDVRIPYFLAKGENQ